MGNSFLAEMRVHDVPARVEVDIFAGQARVRADGDEGQQRESTVAFEFPEEMLASEAEEFYKRLEEVMRDNEAATE